MRTLFERALVLATVAHRDQKRKYTNEPYIVHPIAVAQIVNEVKIGDHAVTGDELCAAAVLHDVIEDCGVTALQIEIICNKVVAELVLEVTDVSTKADGNRRVRKAKDLRHLAGSSWAGATIKLADLIHNTQTITVHDKDFAVVYMREKADLLEVLKHGDGKLWKMAHERVLEYNINRPGNEFLKEMAKKI